MKRFPLITSYVPFGHKCSISLYYADLFPSNLRLSLISEMHMYGRDTHGQRHVKQSREARMLPSITGQGTFRWKLHGEPYELRDGLDQVAVTSNVKCGAEISPQSCLLNKHLSLLTRPVQKQEGCKFILKF